MIPGNDDDYLHIEYLDVTYIRYTNQFQLNLKKAFLDNGSAGIQITYLSLKLRYDK